MITPAFAHTLSEMANQLQVVLGVVTELRRSAQTDAQKLVELEGALYRVVRLMRRLQPKSKEGA